MFLVSFAAEVSREADLNPTWRELLPLFILVVAVTLITAIYLFRQRRRRANSP